MKLSVSVIASALAAAAAGAAEPTLTGVNLAALHNWQIVLGEDAIESESFAAEEYQRLYKQASGTDLPIVRNSTRSNRNIYIGPGKAMLGSAVGFDVSSFGQEDLRIIVRDENIAIAGGRPRGTLYGVYTFLEDYLGVRFLTADHTYVPSVGNWRKVGPIDRFYHPPLSFRWVAYEANYQYPDFAARLRQNAARLPSCSVDGSDWTNAGKYGGRSSMEEIGHSFNQLVPPEKYAERHPEYYCLFQGVHYASLKPGEANVDFKQGSFPYGMQLCLAEPEVMRIVTENVLNQFASRPDLLNVSVAPNDGGAHCQCPSCAAIDAREGSPTGSLLEFVNGVADEVAKKHPDRMVSTLAYSETVRPPKTIRPRENVQVSWCSISACVNHPWTDPTCSENARCVEQLKRWAELTPNLYTWSYFLHDEHNGFQLPLPNLRLIDDNIRFQMSLGVRGMFMQATASCHGNEFEELRNYMLCNLMWDPSRDGDQLMREWLELHYGRAAPPIVQWIGRIHDRALASGKHCRCLGGSYPELGLDETDAQAGIDACEQALQLAGDDPELQNSVEQAMIWAYRAGIDPIWNTPEGKNIDPKLAERMRPRVDRFFKLCKEHDVTRTAEQSWHEMQIFENRLRQAVEVREGS